MKKVLLLIILCFGFANANTDPKVEDLSLLPSKSNMRTFTLCDRITAGHIESVWTLNWENYYWDHQEGGLTVTDEISVGYAIVKCNAWEAHAKLKKADD